ncbi:MAG: glycosyltransferase family 2 protein [Bacteroidales bacterium]|nr:glycosyltransferase family 2 protein [Bacteroidales bacterium]
MTTAFVILHYRTLEVTIQCLENLLKIAPDSPIVVVDNGSQDGSGEEVRRLFGSKVVVVINDQNLGFARGNNAGFQYVKEHYTVDCVVVMNNDVIITQPGFAYILASYMREKRLDVCGPDIITPEGRHQNPLLRKPFSTFRIIKQMAIDAARLLMLKLHLFEKRLLSEYASNSNSFHKQEVNLANITGCVLHGSCVAYSSNYLSNELYAFVPVTFLYGEEMILAEHCRRRNYLTGVCPTATVTHLGGRTTLQGKAPNRSQIIRIKRLMLKAQWELVKMRILGEKTVKK